MKKKATQPKMHPAAFTQAQIAAASAVRDSGGSKTPKAVLAAFAPDAASAGGIEFQPVTMSTILMLQKLDSSLLKQDSRFAVEDILRALFVFSHDIDQVRALLSQRREDGSAPEFDDAVFELGKRVPATAMLEVGAQLNEALSRAFATMIPHGVNKGSDPSSPFPTARTQEPGSAGS